VTSSAITSKFLFGNYLLRGLLFGLVAALRSAQSFFSSLSSLFASLDRLRVTLSLAPRPLHSPSLDEIRLKLSFSRSIAMTHVGFSLPSVSAPTCSASFDPMVFLSFFSVSDRLVGSTIAFPFSQHMYELTRS
jgi:hypothetical protein